MAQQIGFRSSKLAHRFTKALCAGVRIYCRRSSTGDLPAVVPSMSVSRRCRARRRTEAKEGHYLLTGFIRCGVNLAVVHTLLTGFPKCSCGASLAIVTGRKKGGHGKYGCPQTFYRGACPNKPSFTAVTGVRIPLGTPIMLCIERSHGLFTALVGLPGCNHF